jgi:hypothetical protein
MACGERAAGAGSAAGIRVTRRGRVAPKRFPTMAARRPPPRPPKTPVPIQRWPWACRSAAGRFEQGELAVIRVIRRTGASAIGTLRCLFYDLVSAAEQRDRDGAAERLGAPEELAAGTVGACFQYTWPPRCLWERKPEPATSFTSKPASFGNSAGGP